MIIEESMEAKVAEAKTGDSRAREEENAACRCLEERKCLTLLMRETTGSKLRSKTRLWKVANDI